MENLSFAESIQQKINSDPSCDAKKTFMANYDAAEQLMIERSSDVRHRHFDTWQPESGCINIFEN
jgi:hypothetical protein